jgi:competence protein ComEA
VILEHNAWLLNEMKKALGLIALGLVSGLLAAGVLLLLNSPPRGKPISLAAPPTPEPILVHVAGAVLQPGVYPLKPEARLQDALAAAGGLAPNADDRTLNLAAPLSNGDRLTVPTIALTSIPVRAAPGALALPTPDLVDPPTIPGLVDINTATLKELDSLPGIGPTKAQQIIDYRQQHGPFTSIEAIMDVPGIGPVTFERIKDLITTGGVP